MDGFKASFGGKMNRTWCWICVEGKGERSVNDDAPVTDLNNQVGGGTVS